MSLDNYTQIDHLCFFVLSFANYGDKQLSYLGTNQWSFVNKVFLPQAGDQMVDNTLKTDLTYDFI